MVVPIVGPAAYGSPTENILLILLDDFGVDKLGVYGEANACSGTQAQCFVDEDCPAGQTCESDYPLTPNIDQIAAGGILFRNVWSAPVCTPTRATVLTGRYGFRTGVLNIGDDLPDQELTLPEVLSDPVLGSGYVHAAIGKWHLGGGASGPNNDGFSHFAGSLGGGLGDYFNWSRTVDGQTDPCYPGSAACPVDAYGPTVNVSDAIAWIENQTAPWFLYLSLNSPHSPFHIPPHHLVSPGTLARLPQQGGGPAPEGTECAGASRAVCYLAMLEAADAEIDRLLQSLTEPTTIILLGDNGTPRMVVQAPFVSTRAKGSIYEGGINVPMIIQHWSGISAGTESGALAHTADLFATVLELAGASLPTDRAVDGVSLMPLIENPSLTARDTVYSERDSPSAMRDPRLKLIRNPDFDELYDLEGNAPGVAPDPFEEIDLLAGTCSLTSSQVCHADSDCSGAEVCDLPPLTPAQQAAYDSLLFGFDFLQASCDPLACSGPITCATGLTNLRATLPSPGTVRLDWHEPPDATSYDVIRGDVATLLATGGDYSAATDTCLANDLGQSSVTDTAPPSSGQVFWYLTRATASPCNGTYGNGTNAIGMRDYLIGATATACQ
jgi:arylsulfatase A-like enzyme